MKRHVILFLLLGVWMTGCAAPASGPAISPSSVRPAATIDPFIAVEQAQRTAEAAQQEADFYSRQLTATAQAPIISITATAAAWEMEQKYAQATQQAQMSTETAAWTATAMSWTPTPNATSTVIAANALATQQFTNNNIARDDLSVQRERMINPIKAGAFWAVLIVVTIFAGMFAVSWARRFAVIAVPTDARGNPQPMFDVVEMTVMDPDRMANGIISTRRKDVINLMPQITAERQDRVTERDQMVDLRTRVPAQIINRLPKALPDGNSQPQIEKITDGDVPLPDWAAFMQWDGAARPLGMGREGLITTRTASPHVLIAGKTGSGKTLYGLRTMVTASLSRGVYVINVGFSDSGFGVFAAHPNYKAVKFQASADILPFLQAVYGELRARVEMIGGQSADWEHWQGTPPAPFMDIVIDELGNMAEDIYVSEGTDAAKTLWRWVSMIANEGRKVGIRFLAALQDPTAKSVDLRFRRNCTLVAFQQGDASQSSAFLGTTGAESLPVGRFMARVDNVTVGGGFAPTDAEITEYLSRHAARKVDAPKWIDAPRIASVETPMTQPIIEPTAEPAPRDKIAEMAERIREKWFIGMSKNRVAQLCGWNQYGGGNMTKVNAVITYLTSSTSSTAENGAEMPVLGLVGA